MISSPATAPTGSAHSALLRQRDDKELARLREEVAAFRASDRTKDQLLSERTREVERLAKLNERFHRLLDLDRSRHPGRAGRRGQRPAGRYAPRDDCRTSKWRPAAGVWCQAGTPASRSARCARRCPATTALCSSDTECPAAVTTTLRPPLAAARASEDSGGG